MKDFAAGFATQWNPQAWAQMPQAGVPAQPVQGLPTPVGSPVPAPSGNNITGVNDYNALGSSLVSPPAAGSGTTPAAGGNLALMQQIAGKKGFFGGLARMYLKNFGGGVA